MAPILVSASIILGTLLTGDLVRNLIINPKLKEDSLIKKILLDSILALELCASSFEIGVIFQHYGLVVWTFCARLWQIPPDYVCVWHIPPDCVCVWHIPPDYICVWHIQPDYV